MAAKIPKAKSARRVSTPVPSRHSEDLSDHVSTALAIINDESKERVPEGKDSWRAPPPVEYNPAALKVARSVFLPGKIYTFRCVRTATITSSGSGTLQLATSVLPSQFNEYSALAVLFTEARLKSTRIHLSFYSSGASPAVTGYCSSFDPTNISTVPTFAYAVAQPGMKLWSNFGPLAGTHTNEWHVRSPRPWSAITATGSGTDPVSGVAGSWYHSISTPTTASAVVGVYVIEAEYQFRNPL